MKMKMKNLGTRKKLSKFLKRESQRPRTITAKQSLR